MPRFAMKPPVRLALRNTPYCSDATGEPEEYAQVAEKRNLRGVIFTCHNPVPNWGAQVRMAESEFDTYLALVARCRQAMAGRVEVLLGLESDFVPGMEPHLERLHRRAPFNYILGSLHPQLAEYKERIIAALSIAAASDARRAEIFDCLSHPDFDQKSFPSK